MAPSRLIAQFTGPLLLAIGTAILFNRSMFPTLAAEFANSTGLVFLSGLITLTAGIAIVRVHNVWSGGWPIIITVLGWLAVIGGLARMWFPGMAAPIAATLGGNLNVLLVAGVGLSALGALLSYKAYGPGN